MPVIHFKGRILPDHVKITAAGFPPLKWAGTDLEAGSMELKTHIRESNVDIEIELAKYSEKDAASLYLGALDLARIIVDIYCFAYGMGLTLHIDKFVQPDGSEKTITLKVPELSGHCTAFDVNQQNEKANNLEAFYRLVVAEPILADAINDLTAAIRVNGRASINCARAIESLRHLIAPGIERKKQWELMNQNLNLSKSYTELILGISTAPRHGDRTEVPGPLRSEVIDRSWIVMNRFLEFRKRGNQQLPLDEFPPMG